MSAPLIFQKIIDVMSDIEAIGKDRENKMQGFKFRGIDDIYNELHPRMAKHGIFTAPKVLEERREERPTKSGGISTHVIMKIEYTFYAADGSSVQTTMIGEGADSGDKASNKAQAIAHKYALMQIFAIPTEDAKDPDQETTEFAPKKETVAVPSKPSTPFTKPAPAQAKYDPWQVRIPKGWKQNGGKSLEEIGTDGVFRLGEWLKKQERLSPESQKLLSACEDALISRNGNGSTEGDVWP